LGVPTTKNEEWKYTNVAPLAGISSRPASYEVNRATSDLVARARVGLEEAIQAVFVNGYYSPELSSLGRLPQGVEVGSLAAALGGQAAGVEAHLARYADYQGHAFVALNTALMRDGAFVYVP
jgi:Fe-S cluster assembly protein SufD